MSYSSSITLYPTARNKFTSTFRPVLQYSLSSTLVLSRKYWSTAKEVLARWKSPQKIKPESKKIPVDSL